MQVIKKDSPAERTGLTRVFKERVRENNGAIVSDKYQIQLQKSICCCKNQHFGDKFIEGR